MTRDQLKEACENTIHDLLREPFQFAIEHSETLADDLTYQLRSDEGVRRVCVQLLNRLRPGDLPQLLRRFAEDSCTHQMVFADYVTANVADMLCDQNVWFADTQGNAFMEIPGRLLVRNVGNKPDRMPTPTGQHFSVPGAKVLHYLLKHGPSIDATYREIREAIGVSIDKIGKLVRELEQNGTLRVRGSGQYEILAPDRLLRMWVDAYDAKLQPALYLGCYMAAGDRTFEALLRDAETVLPAQLILGSEVAADVLTQHLRPQQLRLYVPKTQAADLRRDLKLAPSERGTVELCDQYAREIAGQGMIYGLTIADAAFVYAELMTDGDSRLAETALRLRQEHLAWTL